ncbi:MAG: dynamin family protein [Cyclobacteriaceae bacterium]|nr:dynamin family protein [Cyclobacteriaceae bacterium]
MKKGPVYHSSHRKEQQSKRNFEKLIEPCVVNWNQRDYGVDGLVTLYAKENSNGNVELDSNHFLVQLKATARVPIKAEYFSLGIDTRKIKDYVKSNISVLLVVNDLQNGLFYALWIDDLLVNLLTKQNPDWISKRTIAIKFSSENLISQDFIHGTRSYLQSKKRNTVSILPGQYFQLRDKVKFLLDRFKNVTSRFGFDSTQRDIDILFDKIELAIYRIAVAGPSRAGKSTLINALLKMNISPIGIYQTTGVPIQIIPGTKNEIIVYFKDNSKHVERFSLQTIEKYVSQTEDLSKVKQIKFVCVSIVNPSLERGISIFDVPGLDDPDDEILQHTLSYVKTFNAIIYLIDVSPHKTGGFAFKSEFKRQLEDMTSHLDKVFLVFNKIDFLTDSELESLNNRIAYDLKRLGLADKVDSKIAFISARKSFESASQGTTYPNDPLYNLEQGIWTYLLEGDKAGIYRLLDVTREIYNSYNSFIDLLNTRLIDSETLEKLHQAIKDIRDKLPELRDMLKNKNKITADNIDLFLESEKHELLLRLERKLKAVPLNESLPKDNDIKKFLISEMEVIITRSNSVCMEQVNLYKNDVDIWIESNLRKIREIVSSNTQTRMPDLSPIETMNIPAIDLSPAFGMGILGGIIAFIINPYAAIGTILGSAAAGFLGLLFFTQETRRARRVTKIVESSRAKCDSVITDLKTKFSLGVGEIFVSVHNYADQKLSLYFSDINNQINKIKTHQLSREEKNDYLLCVAQLKEESIELDKLVSELTTFK